MMLDLHIEGAAPVTLLVRDESRSTRSTSVNKEDDLDPLLDFQDASCSSAASPPLGRIYNYLPNTVESTEFFRHSDFTRNQIWLFYGI